VAASIPARLGPATLLSVNLARDSDMVDNPAAKYRLARHAGQPTPKTGIAKRPVDGPVRIEAPGVVGDHILDTENHGGIWQAVYAYAGEDAEWWQHELGDELTRKLTPGCFGENLTTWGVDVTDAVIGERWRIGEVELEVTKPRIPCSTFAGFWNVAQLVKRFTLAGRPGAYLRVVVPGELSAGQPIEVLDRPAGNPTIAQVFSVRRPT